MFELMASIQAGDAYSNAWHIFELARHIRADGIYAGWLRMFELVAAIQYYAKYSSCWCVFELMMRIRACGLWCVFGLVVSR